MASREQRASGTINVCAIYGESCLPKAYSFPEDEKMIDIADAAKETVTLLAPFLPYLLKAGEGFADEAGKKLGEEAGGGAWEKAKNLWSRLRPKVELKPAALEAVEDVATNPNDEDAVAALRNQLKKLLTEDKSLAEEILKIQDEMRRDGVNVSAIGERSVAIGGNVSGSTIITGDTNKPPK